MRAMLLITCSLLLVACGGGDDDYDDDVYWWFGFDSGAGYPPGGTVIIITDHGKVAPDWTYSAPFAFAAEIPPVDPAALALPAPEGFTVVDAVPAESGFALLLADASGAAFLAAPDGAPEAVPIPAVRMIPAGLEPLRVVLVATDGMGIEAVLRPR